MRQILIGSMMAASLLALTACDSIPYSRQTQGAALGAAAGGVAGHAISGGSALGTIGGAAVGGVVGSEVGRRQDTRR